MKADQFQSTVRQYMVLRHIRTLEDLRGHTTVGSNTTFLKYWKCPDAMPVGVLEDIMSCLNIPQEEKIKLFK